jgi:hypothetical protein
MKLDVQPEEQIALATANIASGWRRLRNTFGFCEESRLEMPEGLILRVQASIRAWPNVFGSKMTEYPQSVFGLVQANWGRLEVRQEALCIAINLHTIRRERLARSGLPGIYQKPIQLDKVGRISLWFSLLILLAEITHREYPDILEWDTQFVMGGRPGSSRRH